MWDSRSFSSSSYDTRSWRGFTPVIPGTGQFWAAGFWSAGFWADGFWGVFEQPYTELKPNLKLFVRTELHKLFVHSDVEQIIAVAELNSLSVLDAASALSLTVNVENNQVSVIQRPSELSVSATPAQMQTTQQDKPNRITARSSLSRIDVVTRPAALYIAQKTHASTFARTLPNNLTSRRERVIQST